jgi:FliZ protein
MIRKQAKRRPLSRYLKDFKHMATHCAHCSKVLDRITLTRGGAIVNKVSIAQLDTLISDADWQEEQSHWAALCRFCGDLYCKEQNNFFDIIGFKQYLFEQTEMSHGTIREYVVRVRRLGNYFSQHSAPSSRESSEFCLAELNDELPETSTNNYRIALRKYDQFISNRNSELR